MKIKIAYANEKEQVILEIEVPLGTTVRQAIEQSQILRRLPDINLSTQKVGIFGNLVRLDAKLKSGDRIEIYRALKMDPKALRLLRSKQ